MSAHKLVVFIKKNTIFIKIEIKNFESKFKNILEHCVRLVT